MGENMCLSLVLCLMGVYTYNNSGGFADPIALAMLRVKLRSQESIQVKFHVSLQYSIQLVQRVCILGLGDYRLFESKIWKI